MTLTDPPFEFSTTTQWREFLRKMESHVVDDAEDLALIREHIEMAKRHLTMQPENVISAEGLQAGSRISRLHMPMAKPEDVIPHLGKPTHYREGRSAYCLANSWFRENDLPELVRLTLDTAPALAGAQLIEGFLERECALGDGGRHSRTDLLALLSAGDKMVVMSVEGKVDEPFGKLVGDELEAPTALKMARIERLSALLGLSIKEAEPLRYQLIHRSAAAIYEAWRFHAQTAVMMVHSFDANDAGSGDYMRFADALSFERAVPTFTAGPRSFAGVDLYLGWTADRPGNESYYIKDRRKSDEGFYDED